MAAKKSWKYIGVLAGVSDSGMSQKWDCRRFMQGFKPICGSHAGQIMWFREANHMVEGVERRSLNHMA